MRHLPLAALMLATALLAGCGGGESTDPSKLPALTAADLEEIRQRDAQVEEEERGTPFVKPGAKGTKVARRGGRNSS
jgi:hypothetical protein